MRTALVAGSTGLVGSSLLRILLQSPHYEQVIILVRKKSEMEDPRLKQLVVDFDQLENLVLKDKITDAYCTLGTTIAKAGSKKAFTLVDHDYVCSFAKKALESGATGFLLVSSLGADPASSIFYNKVKGATEEDLKKLGLPGLVILRPSLLLGPRTEKRTGEKLATWFMKAFDFMIPPRYKAIHVDKVAAKMVETALQDPKGVIVLESDQLH